MDYSKEYSELILIWQNAHLLTIKIYEAVKTFPAEETGGLSLLMKKASTLIPVNLIKVYKKNNTTEKIKSLNTAMELLEECRYYLVLSSDLNYCSTEEMEILLEEITHSLKIYLDEYVIEAV